MNRQKLTSLFLLYLTSIICQKSYNAIVLIRLFSSCLQGKDLNFPKPYITKSLRLSTQEFCVLRNYPSPKPPLPSAQQGVSWESALSEIKALKKANFPLAFLGNKVKSCSCGAKLSITRFLAKQLSNEIYE
jgi:hypothetical protein